MDSKPAESDVPVPAAEDANEEDAEYTPQPSGKRRKETQQVVSHHQRTRPPRWTVPMNEKLKQFYLEYSQGSGSKKQVWEIVAEAMMEAFPYYEFDAKYCHNHYHYCTKLNDHLGDDVDDGDVENFLAVVAEFGDHDGAWFKIALAMKERTGKLRGAKDLKNWYQQIKQQTYGSDDHSAQLLAQVQQLTNAAVAEQDAQTEQVSRDILSSITAALASVEAEAVPSSSSAASSSAPAASSVDADISAVANAVAVAAAALSESAEHAATTETPKEEAPAAEAAPKSE